MSKEHHSSIPVGLGPQASLPSVDVCTPAVSCSHLHLSPFIPYSLISGSTLLPRSCLPSSSLLLNRQSTPNYFFTIGLSFATSSPAFPLSLPRQSQPYMVLLIRCGWPCKVLSCKSCFRHPYHYLVPYIQIYIVYFTHSKTNHSTLALIPLPSSSYLQAFSYLAHRQFA